jgi:hypothetical protein
VPISSDSISVMVRARSLRMCASIAAAIHPAVPPPTITALEEFRFHARAPPAAGGWQ